MVGDDLTEAKKYVIKKKWSQHRPLRHNNKRSQCNLYASSQTGKSRNRRKLWQQYQETSSRGQYKKYGHLLMKFSLTYIFQHFTEKMLSAKKQMFLDIKHKIRNLLPLSMLLLNFCVDISLCKCETCPWRWS